MARAEKDLSEREGVTHVTTQIGGGSPRFLLTYTPESNYRSFGRILVDVDDYRRIPSMVQGVQRDMEGLFPQAIVQVRQFVLGPSTGGKIQLRISGPDPEVLRRLAAKVEAILPERMRLLQNDSVDLGSGIGLVGTRGWQPPDAPRAGEPVLATQSDEAARRYWAHVLFLSAHVYAPLQAYLLELVETQARRLRNTAALDRFAGRSDGARSLPGESAAELDDQREQRGPWGSAA